MKKQILSLLLLGVASVSGAQQAGPVKTFRNKEAKVRANNLHNLTIRNGSLELIAFLKKGEAEKLSFNTDLVLQSRIDTVFDFEADEKRKKQEWKSGFGNSFNYASVDILKSDVIDVASADVFSKTAGLNLIYKVKTGLAAGPAFTIQKGDIQFVTNIVGGRERTFTDFVAKEELKLKSEEGKNLLYEYHSSSADALKVEFKESDSYINSQAKNVKQFSSEDADMLLICRRKPIIKFGKAPSAEDLLPVYYIYRISPKTMDVVTYSKFSEPVARATVYRDALPKNDGILLISAPTDMTGDKSPKDPNPRNYVFRLIGNDTKTKFEFTHEVPSGITQFAQAFEMPDNSIVLMGILNTEKKDKFINKVTLPVSYDACFTMVIKDGKVVSTNIMNAKEFVQAYITPAGEKANTKAAYVPATGLTKHIGTEPLPGGGLLSAWTVNAMDGSYSGDVVLQISADGKLEAKYWLPAANKFVPQTDSKLFKKNDSEYYLLTHTADEKGQLTGSALTQLNPEKRMLGTRTAVGDAKHVLSTKFPFMQLTDSEVQFFGFDKGGKEFWTQRFTF